MNVGGTLKNVGFALGGLLIMAAVFGLAMIFIVGATAASLWSGSRLYFGVAF